MSTDTNLPVEHMSYSSLTKLCTNLGLYEKNYLRGEWDIQPRITTLIGSAFHKFAEKYYQTSMNGEIAMRALDEYVDTLMPHDLPGDQPQDQERLEIKQNAYKLVEFFMLEQPDVKEVLETELLVTTEFDFISGNKAPLPAKAITDLVTRTEHGIELWDWKTVRAFSQMDDEFKPALGETLKLIKPVFAVQAMFNFYTVRAKYNEAPVAFNFVEIKSSKNRDGSPQIMIHRFRFDESMEEYYAVFEELYTRAVAIIKLLDSGVLKPLPNFMDMFGGTEAWADFKNGVKLQHNI